MSSIDVAGIITQTTTAATEIHVEILKSRHCQSRHRIVFIIKKTLKTSELYIYLRLKIINFCFFRHDKNDQNFDSSTFEPPHSFDEQPPPPGDESETQNHQIEETKVPSTETVTEATNNNSEKLECSEVNGSKGDHHHHHKKSRGGKRDDKEASSDDKKSRDKKKRKKSKEHEKKKNKKERKEKKVPGTPEVPIVTATPEVFKEIDPRADNPSENAFNRSDSILDINLEDEWIGVAPEVSKWEREENNKSLENSEIDSIDNKKVGEEKVTSDVIKRAEHVLFTKAISAIRPVVQETVVGNEGQTARLVELKGSIKNRLGKKIVERRSRSRTPPPPVEQRSRKRESPDNRRGKQLSSCIRISNESRRVNDRKRTRTPDERRTTKRTRTPETLRSRHHVERSVEVRSKPDIKKNQRSSSSSSASTNSGETSKRHKQQKMKKRSRSLSADSSNGNKRKKSKKDKKSKKKKKSRKPEKEKTDKPTSDTRRERD